MDTMPRSCRRFTGLVSTMPTMRPAARRRKRNPSIRKMIADAENSGKTVTSVTTPDGATLTFGEPSAAPPATSTDWRL